MATIPTLVALPYDIKHLIFEQLFENAGEIFLQADKNLLRITLPAGPIHTAILRVNRQLQSEAGEYLYNGRLFHIFGPRTHILQTYKAFLLIVKKYARTAPRVDAFGNGRYSSTACISIQAGNSKLPTLLQRRRGEPMTIRQLEIEARGDSSRRRSATVGFSALHGAFWLLFALCAVFVAWWLAKIKDSQSHSKL